MTEATFWRNTVRPALGLFGPIHRIENICEKGTPDTVCCLQGVVSFIELKHSYSWPSRPGTPYRPVELKLEQVQWLESWGAAGGRCCIVAQVDRDYMLFPHDVVRMLYTGLPQADVIKLAAVHGRGTFPTGAMVKWLTRQIDSGYGETAPASPRPRLPPNSASRSEPIAGLKMGRFRRAIRSKVES